MILERGTRVRMLSVYWNDTAEGATGIIRGPVRESDPSGRWILDLDAPLPHRDGPLPYLHVQSHEVEPAPTPRTLARSWPK